MQMYFIAIMLPAGLDEKILHYKKWMAERFGCKVGLKSPAHITIVPPFWMEEELETQLKQDIENMARSTSCFTIYTDNFSAFKPRILFVAVEPNERLSDFKNVSDKYFHATGYKIKLDTREFHPHITIATRDLHKKDFAEAWPHFEGKDFKEKFEAEGLSLLKHNGGHWEVVFTASFLKPT